MLACLPLYCIFEYVRPTFLMLDVTDVVTIALQPLGAVGRCYLPCGSGMADVFCHCGRWNSHFCLFVEDENHI